MTKRRNTKRALLSSVVALLLCFSMLLGSTFAWFTDSVTVPRNTIQSGNLDVVLEYKTDWADDWKEVDENTKIFKEGALYEPGYTEVAYLRVSNAGSLALKYNLNVNVYGETTSTNVDDEPFSLKDYLEIGYYVQDEYSSGANYADILMPSMFGTRDAALGNVTTTKLSADTGIVGTDRPVLVGDDTAQVVAIVLTMPESVGNEANHKTDVDAPTIDLGVSLVATQFTEEEDSFDNLYDEDAEYPEIFEPAPANAMEVDTFEELQDAVANGGNIAIVDDIAVEETLTIAKNTVIYGQGNELTFAGENSFTMVTVGNNATFNNVIFDGGNKVTLNGAEAYAINVNSGAALNLNGSVIKNFNTTGIIHTVWNNTSVSAKNTDICNNTLVAASGQRACLLWLHGAKTTWENVTISGNVVPGNGSSIGDGYLILLRSAGTTFDAINLTIENNECFRIMETYDILATAAFNLLSGSIKVNTGDFNVVGQWTVGEDMKIESNISINNDKQKNVSTLTNNGYIKGDISSSDYHAVSLGRGFAAYTGNGTLDGNNSNLTVK